MGTTSLKGNVATGWKAKKRITPFNPVMLFFFWKEMMQQKISHFNKNMIIIAVFLIIVK